jgi:DNA polymerase IV
MRRIIHIDMDCYFAAVEMRDNPALRHIPLAIGGATERRGVIATCNYEARRFGVRSAMATAYALRLCPTLTVIPGRMAVYQQVSTQLRAIFARYTDRIEPLSLDEAYLDVSDSPLCRGSATRIAEAIREDIRRELQLTASAGIAPNKFLAKIASDLNKPDGMFVIRPEQVAEFVATLPLQKIPGIGQKSAERLAALGLHTGADVQAYPASELLRRFGKSGQMLLERVRGVDDRQVEASRVRKSVGVEFTLPTDLHSVEEALPILVQLEQQLWPRLQRHAPDGRILRQGVKVKFADFQQTTVERSSPRADTGLFLSLLREAWARGEGKSVRLLGLVVSLPQPEENREDPQLSLTF